MPSIRRQDRHGACGIVVGLLHRKIAGSQGLEALGKMLLVVLFGYGSGTPLLSPYRAKLDRRVSVFVFVVVIVVKEML